MAVDIEKHLADRAVVEAELTKAVARAYAGRKEFDALLKTGIRKCRDAGMSWNKIGDAMGITRQGARRYATSVPEKD